MATPLVVALAAVLLVNSATQLCGTALAVCAATPASSIDRTVIKEVVRRHTPAIRRCYEAALAKQPTLVGRMVVRFTITSSGSVSSAAVVQSTLRAPAMEACVLNVFGRWSSRRTTART